MVLDFLSESALLAGERCLAARVDLQLPSPGFAPVVVGVCGDPSHGCGVSDVTWASKAQVKVSFYLANGLFSQQQPPVSYTAVTSLPVSVSSAASSPARLCSVGGSRRELVSH